MGEEELGTRHSRVPAESLDDWRPSAPAVVLNRPAVGAVLIRMRSPHAAARASLLPRGEAPAPAPAPPAGGGETRCEMRGDCETRGERPPSCAMSEVLGRAAATGEPLAAAWVGVPFEAGGGGGTAAESCLDELGVASSARERSCAWSLAACLEQSGCCQSCARENKGGGGGHMSMRGVV